MQIKIARVYNIGDDEQEIRIRWMARSVFEGCESLGALQSYEDDLW